MSIGQRDPARVHIVKLLIGTVVLIVFIIYGLIWLISVENYKKGLPKSDPAQIQSSLQDAFDASSKGNSGKALDLLLASIKVNGTSADKGALGAYIRKLQPKITMSQFSAVVDGNKAEVTVNLSILIGKSSQAPFEFPRTQLLMEREIGVSQDGLPKLRWQVSKVESQTSLPEGMLNLGLP